MSHPTPLAAPSLGHRYAEVECDGVRLARVRHAPNATMSHHAHAHASLTLVLAGRFDERTASASHRLTSLTAVYKPPGMPHATRVGTRRALSINVALPLETARGLDATYPAVVRCGPLVIALLELLDAFAGGRAEVGVGLQACLARLGESIETSNGGRDRLVDRARVLASRGMAVRAMAERLRVCPTTLWRRFHRRTGVSPSVWRRRAMVSRAAAQLSGTSAPIASIAAACGFADQPHLTRAFRRETGLTPLAYRRLASEHQGSAGRPGTLA